MPLTKQEADQLIGAIKGLVAASGSEPSKAAEGRMAQQSGAGRVDAATLTPDLLEYLYREFRQRLIDDLRTDPVLMQLYMQRQELVVEVTPTVVEVDGRTLKGRVASLIAKGWFDDARTTGATRKTLASTGADPGGGGGLSTVLSELKRDGFLVDEAGGWRRAADLAVSERRIER